MYVGRLRVALCQLNAVVGDLDGNVERILAALAEAEGAGADLAVFPELAITGYPPEDLLVNPSFVEGNLRALERVAERTGTCAAVIGFVDDDGDLYNAAAVCAGGKTHGIWHKELLPNYGVFDERRWFRSGASTGVPDHLYLVNGVRLGVVVCEDAWSPTGPVARLGAGGAELVVVLNGSPYRAGVLAERRRMLATRAADASVLLAYVNLVGGQDELVFDGGSMIFDHDGTLLAAAPQFRQATLLADVDLRPAYRKRILDPRGRPDSPPLPTRLVTGVRTEQIDLPLPRSTVASHIAPELIEAEEVYEALVMGTRDYVDKNGFSDVLISLSGGVDSALVAAVAVDAIGPARVHGVLLPSRYS
jgi:NAD+ synthase (glutamine-hydrolysing)